MKYSEIIEIEPFFDSTFNMTEEKENYWKQFITNEKFESNLKEIVNAFTSLTGDQHKSIWVQGTYGTGKSHSTAVIKHLLSDDLDDITDYIDKLACILQEKQADSDTKGMKQYLEELLWIQQYIEKVNTQTNPIANHLKDESILQFDSNYQNYLEQIRDYYNRNYKTQGGKTQF